MSSPVPKLAQPCPNCGRSVTPLASGSGKGLLYACPCGKTWTPRSE